MRLYTPEAGQAVIYHHVLEHGHLEGRSRKYSSLLMQEFKLKWAALGLGKPWGQFIIVVKSKCWEDGRETGLAQGLIRGKCSVHASYPLPPFKYSEQMSHILKDQDASACDWSWSWGLTEAGNEPEEFNSVSLIPFVSQPCMWSCYTWGRNRFPEKDELWLAEPRVLSTLPMGISVQSCLFPFLLPINPRKALSG